MLSGKKLKGGAPRVTYPKEYYKPDQSGGKPKKKRSSRL